MKKTTDENRDILARSRAPILQRTEGVKKQLSVEKERSGFPKTQMADILGQVARVKKLLRISSSKDRTGMENAETMDARRSGVLVHQFICAHRCFSDYHAWMRKSKIGFLYSVEG